jgi:hypothetical protein
MLLNEFLKEHRKMQELQATVAQQRSDFQTTTQQQQKDFESKLAQQQKQIEALTATVRKVSEQVALRRPAGHLVTNP